MATKVLTSVSSLVAYVERENPSVLVVSVSGEAPSTGYSHMILELIENVAPPDNGIYEMLLLGTPPEENLPFQRTYVHANTLHWINYPADLKGIAVIALENSMIALPESIDEATAAVETYDEENY